MKHLITPKKILVLVLMLFIFFSFSAIGKMGQDKYLSVVTMMAVDKLDDEYQVSAKTIVPATTKEGAGSEKVFTYTGETVSDAVNGLERLIGNQLGMAHCNLIALSDKTLSEDIEDITDYFIRTKKVGKNTLLVACGESAREFMFATAYMSNVLLIKMDAVLEYNKSDLKATSTTLDDFYKGYESPPAVTILPVMTLTDDDSKGILVQVEPSSSQTPLPEGKTKYFVNDGSTHILKKGIKVWTLNPDEVRAMNYFLPETKNGKITLNDVTDDKLTNAKIVLKILEQNTSTKATFEDGKPVYNVDVSLTVLLEDIAHSDSDEQKIDQFEEIITDEIKQKTIAKVTAQMQDIITKAKSHNCDVLDVYKNFYRTKYRKWKNYLSSLPNQDDYLAGVDIKVNVEVKAGI